jgi:mannose-6-phosphate isomerase-like protein (cupin superfamily)
MQTVYFHQRDYVPASHEDPLAPGVWKKILLGREDVQAGRVQMVNWARLPVGQAFAPHYHEDLQEIFVIVSGQAEITAGTETAVLRRGDVVSIAPREVHQMRNCGDTDVEYVVLGIAAGVGGKTVVVSLSQERSQP